MKTNLNKNHFRQGDVGIAKILNAKELTIKGKIKPKNNRIILAYGEATGHHHSISLLDYPDVEMFDVVGYAEKILLRVGQKGAVIEHQEHAPITLSEGWYEVHIQVEYDPEGERRVQD